MKVLDLEPGKYVLAISGGVDSMVLLDIIRKQSNVKLVLAHFNHGIRADSHKDELLVKQTAKLNCNILELGNGYLGHGASEDLARNERYRFLESIAQKHNAGGIVTAHHQDDLIETAFLNILRGTGYRGLTAIYVNSKIQRPLIKISKHEILKYAKSNGLKWHEDSTNQDMNYLRNYVRKYVMPKLNKKDRQQIVKIVEDVAIRQSKIEKDLATMSQFNSLNSIDRQQFINLPVKVSNELLTYRLRRLGLKDYDKKTIERLSVAIKTAFPGTSYDVKNKFWLKFGLKTAQLTDSS